jgi:hypothetical protein
MQITPVLLLSACQTCPPLHGAVAPLPGAGGLQAGTCACSVTTASQPIPGQTHVHTCMEAHDWFRACLWIEHPSSSLSCRQKSACKERYGTGWVKRLNLFCLALGTPRSIRVHLPEHCRSQTGTPSANGTRPKRLQLGEQCIRGERFRHRTSR